jgi:murein DD-endopeptidase MepM/ murein hydrolase activator NlpD
MPGRGRVRRATLASEVGPMSMRRRCAVLLVALLVGVPVGGAAAATRPAGDWGWPLPPPHRVVAAFDPPARPWLPGQRGVDLAGHAGERVLSSGDGIVSFAGPVAGIGVVSVTTGALRTTYEPVRPVVHAGDQVSRGTVIGRLVLRGSQCLPAACLHWGLLRGSTYLDPLALLGLATVRLLPLDLGYAAPPYP